MDRQIIYHIEYEDYLLLLKKAVKVICLCFLKLHMFGKLVAYFNFAVNIL